MVQGLLELVGYEYVDTGYRLLGARRQGEESARYELLERLPEIKAVDGQHDADIFGAKFTLEEYNGLEFGITVVPYE